MKKYLYFAAALAMGACASDEYVGQGDVNVVHDGMEAMNFGTTLKTTTRATEHTGADAAVLLDNNYVVEGIKYAGSPSAQVEVFDHYNVNYYSSTANSTESNSRNWEYAGQDQNIKGTSAKLSAATMQSIKYWDYAASQYDFVAVSLGKGQAHDAVYDAGAVLASETSLDGYYTKSEDVYTACASDGKADGSTKYYKQTTPGSTSYAELSDIDYTKLGTKNATYTLTGTYDEIAAAYVADLVSAYKAEGEFGEANVITPKFRRAGAKVRLAFYETVPGYAVHNIKFYTEAWDGSTATSAAGQDKAVLFTANNFFVPTTGDGVLSVSYPTVGYSNKTAQGYNQAVVSYAPASTGGATLTKTMQFAAVTETTKEGSATCDYSIGRTSATASYAGDYVTVIPQGKGENLQIRIEYDLYPIDGAAEVIHVRDARAVVPAEYANWKANYAYTYIFKISDATNGWTGVDGSGNVVEGLTPITFDAVVVDTEDGIQETITAVATPSITTYQEGKVVTAGSEYVAGDVYASVMNGTTEVDLSSLSAPAGVAVYDATATDPSIITEALVQDQLNGTKHDTGITLASAGYTIVSEVPSADGNTLAVSACKFTVASGKTYVFQYTDGSKNYVKVIRVQ